MVNRLIRNMEPRKMKVKSWNRFLTRNLAVKPEVLGCEHCFSFDNIPVSIKIPNIEQVKTDKINLKGGYGVASVGTRRAADNEPLEFYIHMVDVEVSIPGTLSIPSELLNRPPNTPEVLKLDKVAEQYQLIAENAFEYWIRIVRWVCDDSRIGQNKVENYRSGWGTDLIDAECDTEVWAPVQRFYALGYKVLSVEEWKEIQSKLSLGSQPPIHVEFRYDAEENIRLGDYRRSLVDMAIACELFLRFAVLQRLPRELNTKLTAYIEKANISQYIDHFFPDIIIEYLTKSQLKKFKSDLHSLFQLRNDIVHMGKCETINEALCHKFLNVTLDLERKKLHPVYRIKPAVILEL